LIQKERNFSGKHIMNAAFNQDMDIAVMIIFTPLNEILVTKVGLDENTSKINITNFRIS
jgi:hypothetical protein